MDSEKGNMVFDRGHNSAYAELVAAGFSLQKNGAGRPRLSVLSSDKTEQEACAVDSSVLFG